MEMTDSPAARSRDGLLGQLFAGRLRWDLLARFPTQDPDDARRGDAVIAEMRAFLAAHVDPDEVEASGALPRGYVDGLRAHRLLNLQPGPELGGRGLSFLKVMRAIEDDDDRVVHRLRAGASVSAARAPTRSARAGSA